MGWVKQLFTSSIGRKFAMALSALFLIVFLFQHFIINFTSTISEETFNQLSHFMGTNPIVQFVLQPILMFGVTFHFVMGFVLEFKNKSARGEVKYYAYKGNANASWFSRNMIWSGLFILFFLGFHFYDFWIPEMNYKYIQFNPEDPDRYYEEVVHIFENPIRVGIYSLSFVFLSLHLLHGFQSAFLSIGARHPKYLPAVQQLGRLYAILVPVGYIYIALYHFIVH
ncbi:MAG: succinate dehydrogenase cytochrome b subunit [Bacteroidota bacterium]